VNDIKTGAKQTEMAMVTLLLILAAIFVIAGWGTAEMNYRTERTKANKLQRTNLLLKQKAEKLESVVEHTSAQYEELNTAYEYSKQRSTKQAITEAENEDLKVSVAHYQDAIAWVEKKIRSREYTNNALARVIKSHLEHAFPSQELQEQRQLAESKETFQRIKKTMGE
jgi:hypothetical protein